MRKREWKHLLTGILVLVMLLFIPYPAQAAGKVLNNGDDVIQSGNYVYYLANHGDSKGNSYDLCRMKTNNKSKKVLDSWKGSAGALFLSGNKLYYQRGEFVYSSPLNKKKPKKIVEGELVGVYGSNIYYISGTYGDMKLYTMKTNGTGKKKLLSSYEEIWSSGCDGEKLIVSAKVSSDKTDIVYVNMSKKMAKVLTSEGKKDDYVYSAGRAWDIYIYKNTLYYASGILQGTGFYFYGDFKKINLDGTGKETIDTDICPQAVMAHADFLLHTSGGYIYYYKDGVKKYSLSNGKVSSVPGSDYYNVAGKYVYYAKGDTGSSTVSIYRYNINSGEKKAKKVLTLKKNKKFTYSISDIVQVGDYLYIDLDVRLFDKNTNWHGEYKGIETYKMSTSFKNVKKLN